MTDEIKRETQDEQQKQRKPPGTIAVTFLGDLRPAERRVMLTAISPEGGPTTTKTFTDLDQARRFIVQRNDNADGHGQNIYFTSAITKQVMATKPKKSDISAVAYLHVDADPRKDETSEDFKARMRPQIDKFEPAPTFVIDTGNGFQLLWELHEPVEITSAAVISDIEARNTALAVALGADPGTQNIERLLRVPGTTNYPNAAKRKLGRTVCRARYLSCNDTAYPLSAFPPHVEPTKEKTTAQGSATDLPPKLGSLLHISNPDPGGYKTRSELLFAFLLSALRANVTDAVILAACLDRKFTGRSIFEHVSEHGGRKYLERQLARAKDKLGSQTASSASSHSWEDPDISLLDDRRGELPDFPLETLAPELEAVVQRVAHGVGTTADHVIVPLLGIASSLIGTARRAKASTSWSQPFTLWCAVVDYSGGGKTPGLDATKKALDQVELERQGSIAERRREHEARAELARAAKAEWKAAVEQAREDNETPPPKPPEADDPGAFIAPRLYVIDVTIERLAQLLTARPLGMLLIRDELAGWFHNMGRYSGGDDRQFWLICWDGGAYNVERKQSPPITISNLLVGVVGGLQPDKMADCFEGAADGVYARFLFAWPARAPFRALAENIQEVDDDILEIVRRLSSGLEQPGSQRIPLSPKAKAIFEDLRKVVYDGAEALEGRARDWWAKIPAHALRLAGALAYLRWGLAGGPAAREIPDEPKEIASVYMASARTLMLDYFWAHAQACLRQIGLTQRHADARRVLRWLKANQSKDVSREDVRRNALGRQRDADTTEEVLNFLARAGWLRQQKTETGGRPAVRWQVNPKLMEVE